MSTPTCATGLMMIVLAVVQSIVQSAALRAAETGDFDGDGRLSIADVLHRRDGGEPAPGSLQGFEAHPCFGSSRIEHTQGRDDAPIWSLSVPPALTLLESLRRNVDDPLPHWGDVWNTSPDARRQAPLPETPLVHLTLERAVALGVDDRVRLEFLLTVFEPIKSFVFILESDGALNVPFFRSSWPAAHWWNEASFEWTASQSAPEGIAVIVSPSAFLITGGRYVISQSLFREPLDVGEHRIIAEARLERGLQAGVYPLSLLPGSEVVFVDGRLARPMANGEWSVVVEREIETGRPNDVVPIRLDAERRRVLGKIEFRVVDRRDPVGAGDGAVVIPASPGEALPLGIQMRTEVPLNYIAFDLRWPNAKLRCTGVKQSVFPDLESGNFYSHLDFQCVTNWRAADGAFQVEFLVGGAEATIKTSHTDRPLEYFKPLEEWVDLASVTLEVAAPEGADEFPLVFAGREVAPFPFYRDRGGQFVPFSTDHSCDGGTSRDSHLPDHWAYDVVYHGATVVTTGGEDPIDPIDPADPSIRFFVADATGSPGELVRVPAFASSEMTLRTLRLALNVDPGVVTVEGFDVPVFHQLTGELGLETVSPGGTSIVLDCPEEAPDEDCVHGVPILVKSWETPPGSVLLELTYEHAERDPVMLDGTLREVAALLVRIRDDASVSQTLLEPGPITFQSGLFETTAEPGGALLEDRDRFLPAGSIRAGTLTIDGARSVFRRGDADASGTIDLTDAVNVLGFLFLHAGAPACLDAADADDSGDLSINDPVLVLGALFAGAGQLPEPRSECGPDPTEDGLDCAASCAR